MCERGRRVSWRRDQPRGAALYIGGVAVSNVNIVGNEVEVLGAGDAAGPTVHFEWGDIGLQWTCNNVYGSGHTPFSGLDDPEGTSGNLAVDPQYIDTSSTDPREWDLRLAAGAWSETGGKVSVSSRK